MSENRNVVAYSRLWNLISIAFYLHYLFAFDLFLLLLRNFNLLSLHFLWSFVRL